MYILVQGAKEMEGGHAFHVPGIGHDARGGARAFQVTISLLLMERGRG